LILIKVVERLIAAALGEIAVEEGVIEISDLEEIAKEMGLLEE